MKLFEGKTLLMLGSNVASTEIVEYAKKNGAYTITVDYLPTEKSEAKLISDKNFMISTGDIDSLSELIKEYHVDAVLAGIHEFNLLQAMKLSELHKLPFYCNREQWDTIENKSNFRNICNFCGVPCPKTYYVGEKIQENVYEKIEYPVVIKPIDACASAGVHICKTEEKLRSAERDALQNSKCGRIIVEQFVEGTEFTAHYTICNGVASLSSIDNRYPVSVHEGDVTTIPVARIYPSLFIDEYIRLVNEKMLNLCNHLQLKNAVLFIQGLYDGKGHFSIFEGGLRSAGESPNRFISQINGINYIHLLVENALLGKAVTFETKKENPYLNGKCCGIVSFVTKGGRVGTINGLEDAVKKVSSVIEYESRYPVGTETPNGDTLRQLMIRFVMICESREQMIQDVSYLNDHITVLDSSGKNMVIKLIPERILDVY